MRKILLTAFVLASVSSAVQSSEAQSGSSVQLPLARDRVAREIHSRLRKDETRPISLGGEAKEDSASSTSSNAVAPDESVAPVPQQAVRARPAPGSEALRSETVAPAMVAKANESAAAVREPSSAAKEHAPAAAEGSSPEDVLKVLKAGNEIFVRTGKQDDAVTAADREAMTKGQQPHSIVLSCSDSRVPPNTVFTQKPGKIFAVRTAGESIDSAVLASIEYAVEHLGSRLIVVMGHTQCGAVKAALETPVGKSAGSPSLDKLVEDIRPRLPARETASESSKDLLNESSANARGVADDLVKRSPIIKKYVEQGKVMIKPALYHLDSGRVQFY